MRVHPLALAALLCASPVLAQQGFPTVTTIAALTRYPIFFHAKPVVIAGEFGSVGERTRLVAQGGEGPGIEVLWRGTPQAPSGTVEVRGLFLDVGRLAPSDPQATMNGVQELVQWRTPGRWPAHGELLALLVSSVVPLAPPAAAPGLRALALDPMRYAGQRVTVAGQFGGRNLFGDMPRAPATSRDEFVLRNAGAAIWVTGLPPEGKKWGLDPDSRLDTSAWLEVRGTVREGGGIVWIEAAALQPTTAKAQLPDPLPPPPPIPSPPPKVVFSLPAADETDVAPASTIKFQLSRDLDPDTLAGQIQVSYVGAPSDAAAVPFKATWDRDSRVLALSFEKPLDRFRGVRVELRGGIKGTDGQALVPYTLTFSVGGD